jgi:hypothetical protein
MIEIIQSNANTQRQCFTLQYLPFTITGIKQEKFVLFSSNYVALHGILLVSVGNLEQAGK